VKYGPVAEFYDSFLALSGFKVAVNGFLDRMDFNLPSRPRILDAGCGTGLLSFYLAQRFPDSEIYASDVDVKMLCEMERLLKKDGGANIAIYESDLKTPERLSEPRSHEVLTLPPDFFDLIAVSGALEHVPLAETAAKLSRLLKPGGIFFNLAMRKDAAGAILALMYEVKPYTLQEMRRAFEEAGLEAISVHRLSAEDFPANLSRVAILARKKI